MTILTYNKIISLKLAKRIIISLIFVIFFEIILFPVPAIAGFDNTNDLLANKKDKASFIVQNTLPENNDLEVVRTEYHQITSYNSEPGQTDSTPCITANGYNLCENNKEDSVAANFLRFGTRIKIPELFGDKVFVVRDRMNKRHNDRVDIWMKEKADSKAFGIQYAKIEILDIPPP